MGISKARYIVGWIVSLIVAIVFSIVYRAIFSYTDIVIVIFLSIAVMAILSQIIWSSNAWWLAIASFLFGILGIIWSFILACFNGNVATIILALIIIGPVATLSFTVIAAFLIFSLFAFIIIFPFRAIYVGTHLDYY